VADGRDSGGGWGEMGIADKYKLQKEHTLSFRKKLWIYLIYKIYIDRAGV
jgi:hypothetical protein